MQTNRPDDAFRLWSQVLARDANHPRALLHLGQHALYYDRNIAQAASLLDRAAAADPKNPVVALNRASVARAAGDADAEMAALTQALTLDAYFLPALLAKGALYERLGKPRQAAKIYANVLSIAPPEPPPWLAEPLAKARALVEANRAALNEFFDARLAEARAEYGTVPRFEEARDILTGAKRIQPQAPTLLHYPRLPAIPFYQDSEFPWLEELGKATGMIRDELQTLLAKQDSDFAPYVKHPAGVPLNQWAELNHSPRWGAWFLWQDGVRRDEACAQCPETASLLARMPMADVADAAPSAFFSCLKPKTRIPPHTGVTNTRLIVHLPLIVPPGCTYRVGNETREWVVGKPFVFDDSIEHEAWNGSDDPRYILIFDIWNPYLSDGERALVRALLAAHKDFYAWE
jgi:aspartyl/asparaginyl beta-hydroxylase (cupin superfamily)